MRLFPQRRTPLSCVFLLALIAACSPTTPPPTPATTPTPVLRLTAATVPGAHTHLAAWARLYERNHPGVVIEIRSDTFARVQEAAVGGSADIVALDQEPLVYYQGGLTVTHVADEPIALIVHPENVVDSLSVEVVAQVLSGRVGDWSEIGGPAVPLQVYLLPDSAGEIQYVDSVALAGQRLAPQAIVCASASTLLRAVAGDRGAIGVLRFGAIAGQVGILAVDGLRPCDAGYPWQMPLFLGYGPAAPLQARDFVEYIGRQR